MKVQKEYCDFCDKDITEELCNYISFGQDKSFTVCKKCYANAHSLIKDMYTKEVREKLSKERKKKIIKYVGYVLTSITAGIFIGCIICIIV